MYWVQVLSRLQHRLKPQTFQNWFKPTHQVHEDDDQVMILIPSPFFRDVIQGSYMSHIQACVRECGLKEKELRFVTSTEWESIQMKNRSLKPVHPDLNPLYTFENFVEGQSNQNAYAASRAVADHPGMVYNPLFIYGGVGLGKTHLLHAIGNFVYQQRPQLKVVYVSCDALMNQLVEAYRRGTVHEMRKYYRTTDVLLLDDVHTLGGKERTQEELFSLFNILYQAGKQIVLTADQPPQKLTHLEKRLISRFSWGLVTDIQPPELEVRMAILIKKAQIHGFQLPDDVALFIAENVTENVRLLEGALKSLIFHASTRSQPISIELAREAIATMVGSSPTTNNVLEYSEISRITIDDIADVVSNYFGFSKETLFSRSHRPRIVLPRQITMYLARHLLQASLPEIGNYFKKHHTTVMHGVQKIEELLDHSPKLKDQIHEIIQILQERNQKRRTRL